MRLHTYYYEGSVELTDIQLKRMAENMYDNRDKFSDEEGAYDWFYDEYADYDDYGFVIDEIFEDVWELYEEYVNSDEVEE